MPSFSSDFCASTTSSSSSSVAAAKSAACIPSSSSSSTDSNSAAFNGGFPTEFQPDRASPPPPPPLTSGHVTDGGVFSAPFGPSSGATHPSTPESAGILPSRLIFSPAPIGTFSSAYTSTPPPPPPLPPSTLSTTNFHNPDDVSQHNGVLSRFETANKASDLTATAATTLSSTFTKNTFGGATAVEGLKRNSKVRNRDMDINSAAEL